MNGLAHDGIVYIAELTNTAEAGDKPAESLSRSARFWFESRMIGAARQFAAQGARARIDMIVRIHGTHPSARIGNYAVLGNGDQFRILNVSEGMDDTSLLKFTELTLERLDHLYDVIDG